jgi:hypothetical protein
MRRGFFIAKIAENQLIVSRLVHCRVRLASEHSQTQRALAISRFNPSTPSFRNPEVQ